MRMRVEANEEERAALAERFEFLNLHHLSANVSVARPRWGCVVGGIVWGFGVFGWGGDGWVVGMGSCGAGGFEGGFWVGGSWGLYGSLGDSGGDGLEEGLCGVVIGLGWLGGWLGLEGLWGYGCETLW